MILQIRTKTKGGTRPEVSTHAPTTSTILSKISLNLKSNTIEYILPDDILAVIEGVIVPLRSCEVLGSSSTLPEH